MKKLLLVLQFVFLTALSLCAAPYATYEEINEDTQEYEFMRPQFLAQAMKGSVRIKIEYDGYTPAVAEKNRDKKLVSDAIKTWFSSSAKMIRKYHRRKEFQDVYPMFAQGIVVNFVTSQPHVTVRFYLEAKDMQKECGSESSGACFGPDDQKISVVRAGEKEEDFNDEKLLLSHLTHEFGHAFGLADQYSEELYSDGEISRRYTSPEVSEHSIMNGWNEVAEDDVDGLINVIDLERKAKGKPSPRKPWRSFAGPGRWIYHHGEEVGKDQSPRKNFIWKEKREKGQFVWTINYDYGYTKYVLKGLDTSVDLNKVIQEPIQLKGKVVPFGTTHGTGPNGEKVICYDMFNRTLCFGMVGDYIDPPVQWVQLFERDPYYEECSDRGIDRTLYFKYKERFITLKWIYGVVEKDLIDFSVSEEPIAQGEDVFMATLDAIEIPNKLTIHSESKESKFLMVKPRGSVARPHRQASGSGNSLPSPRPSSALERTIINGAEQAMSSQEDYLMEKKARKIAHMPKEEVLVPFMRE